jgi:hypothetical protein
MAAGPHEIRMAASTGALTMLDALDDETLALFEPAVESLTALAEQLGRRGMPRMHVTGLLVGLVVQSALQAD